MNAEKTYLLFKTVAGLPEVHFLQCERYLCGFLLCLSLIIPTSVGAQPAAGYQDFPAIQALFETGKTDTFIKQDIWISNVGEGFRRGTQVASISAGAAYGVLIFGGEERHHLSLISASYGQMIGGVQGMDKWYRGNWEIRAEIFGGAQFNSETCALAGITPHIRYHFATGTRLIPYFDLGAGLSLTEIRGPDLGGAFEFNLQAVTGFNYFIKDNLSINIAMQYLHLSSASICMPNNGVNTVGCFLGVQWFF